jgi:hypothetical protein
MEEQSLGKLGGCRCGQVRFEAKPPVLLTMACHCKGCQRMTASAFSLSEMYAGANFELLSGSPVQDGMKASSVHYVCPECSCWVYTKVSSTIGDFNNVRATMFDDVDQSPPFLETCSAEKLEWVEIGATHRYEKFPPHEKFGGLIQEFMARPT